MAEDSGKDGENQSRCNVFRVTSTGEGKMADREITKSNDTRSTYFIPLLILGAKPFA